MKRKIGIVIFLVISLLGLINFTTYASDVAVTQTRTGVETALNHPAAYLVDHNQSTYWSLRSAATEGWVELTLAQPTLIYGLKLSGEIGSDARLNIEYQSDGNWVPFTAGWIKSLSNSGLVDLSWERTVTQTIRLRLSGSAASVCSLREVEVLGETVASIYHLLQPNKVSGDKNTSLNAPAAFLSDGNTYTGWQLKSPTSDGEALFELPVQSNIKNINIYFNHVQQGNIKLEALINNGWEQLAVISGQSVGWYRLDLGNRNINTTQIRLTATGGFGIDPGISEVELWGYGAFVGDYRQIVGNQQPLTITPIADGSASASTAQVIKVLSSCANSATIINSIQHNIKIYNTSTQAINLADIKLRYWYTNETKKQQVAQIYWSNIGSQNVTTQFGTVSDKVNADAYMELGFIATAGTLAPGNYVEIKLGLNASDWSSYNQLNDFSFNSNLSYMENSKYTGYYVDKRTWGMEPESTVDAAVNLQFIKPAFNQTLGSLAADGRLKVLYQSANTAGTINSIQMNLKVQNTSNSSINLADVKLRYWYSDETKKQQVINKYWSNIGAQKVKARFVPVDDSVGADTCLELGFTDGVLAPGETVEIKLGFNAQDWSNYQQANDYSFTNNVADYSENPRITGYLQDKLAWGTEPNTQPIFNNTTYRLELVFSGELTEPAVIELNNTPLELKPALTSPERTIYSCQVPNGQLSDNVNFLRIKPFQTAVTLENAFIACHNTDGERLVPLGSLNDGLLLTAAEPTATEWQLGQSILIEEATVTSGDNASARLFVWANNDWLEMTNWQNLEWGTRFTGPVTTDRLKLVASGPVGEICIKGSVTTDQAPTVHIFRPQDGETVTVSGWAQQDLIGLVDNPQSVVAVNGNNVTVNGHYFTMPLANINTVTGELKTLTATAKDPKGRTGSTTVNVTKGDYTDITLDQADILVYTDQSTFTISGNVKNQVNQYQVNVAGSGVTISGNRFVTSVSLHEGSNLIAVQCFKNGQLVKTFYRRVVRNSAPIGVSIQAPADGAYLNVKTVKVTGSITGLAPLKVTVNGVATTVSANNYFATVALTEGSNKITVVAQDANGKKTTKIITVCRDTKAPVISDASPTTGQFLASATITAQAKISDANSFWVTINGQAITGDAGLYQRILNLADGAQTITITAQDVAGNTTTYTAGAIIDTVPPEAFTPVADATGWSNNNKPTITFSTTDATSGIDHYEIAVGDGNWKTSVVSPYQFADALADGELIIQVKAVDKAGNITIGKVKVSIDTVPPGAPANFRPVPGNAKMILKWDKPSEDTVKYQIERVLNDTDKQFAATENIYTDAEVENGISIKYRVWAIDRAGNAGPSTDWQTAKVGLAEVPYQPGQGAVVEYENVVLCLPDTGVPKDVAKVEVTEIQSEHLTNQAIYPIISPIYEFSTVKAGETQPQESTIFEKGYLAKIEYDPTKLPEGFLEENLGVYYYNPMFDRWFLVKGLGVDKEHHTIYFITNHFKLPFFKS
jgi:uncharacterized protein YccT (UPF0319 family)